MRYLVIIILLFTGVGAFAQQWDTEYLLSSVDDLNFALVNRDTTRLKTLLRDDLHYFHSNGWLQTKREIVEDLYNGKLTYNKVSQNSREFHIMGEIANVKTVVDIEAVMNGKPIQLKLKVVQIWAKKNNRWELFSRRSEKV
jgi:Domain of unknown function (DUF4440)